MRQRDKKKRLSECGMTLVELLASLLIMSMVTIAVCGGVVAVQKAYRRTAGRSEAELVLATTAELLSAEFSGAVEESEDSGSLTFRNGKDGVWMSFANDPEKGICKVYAGASQSVPLLSNGAMADHFYTKFESCTYENACFTVKNLAVYEKAEANEDGQTPAAILPELTVRAVNLEGL